MQTVEDSERQRGGAANVSMINTVKDVHLLIADRGLRIAGWYRYRARKRAAHQRPTACLRAVAVPTRNPQSATVRFLSVIRHKQARHFLACAGWLHRD